MTDFASFSRHLDDVHKAARIVIEKKSSKAHWPPLISEKTGEDEIQISFAEPAVVWNAPMRGSSTGSRIKRTIVMSGHFSFSNNVLDKAGANVEIYETAPADNGGWSLTLLDAMHFDIEGKIFQTPFHPMFHVQFGKNKRIGEDDIRKIVCELSRLRPDQVTMDRSLETPSRDIRIPTPQMDYMSVLAMVVADYFCDSHSGKEVRTGFRNLLRKVMHASNPARSSSQSRNLENRWNPEKTGPFCASHWYQESCM
ncbi:hypothetical protein [Achromobacter sp. NFACC18-2]|uniref:hypothetical protein n=1 Tax=Achromobacter sp. NFACC18-2 TaxID=1564112 RepID=UPI0008C67D59|nr:hypothetical protein [Achromobacter sp. NFACC18-2]SEI66740.1 hypothetical protein SAMN03159494_00851 [Achromobacter sp. NFACC18-2]